MQNNNKQKAKQNQKNKQNTSEITLSQEQQSGGVAHSLNPITWQHGR